MSHTSPLRFQTARGEGHLFPLPRGKAAADLLNEQDIDAAAEAASATEAPELARSPHLVRNNMETETGLALVVRCAKMMPEAERGVSHVYVRLVLRHPCRVRLP